MRKLQSPLEDIWMGSFMLRLNLSRFAKHHSGEKFLPQSGSRVHYVTRLGHLLIVVFLLELASNMTARIGFNGENICNLYLSFMKP